MSICGVQQLNNIQYIVCILDTEERLSLWSSVETEAIRCRMGVRWAKGMVYLSNSVSPSLPSLHSFSSWILSFGVVRPFSGGNRCNNGKYDL